MIRLRRSAFLAVCLAAFAFSPALKADQIWNFDFSGTDCCSDTLTITGTITTAPGTSPLTIDAVNLTYYQVGLPGVGPSFIDSDSSTTLSTTYSSADNLLSTTAPFLDDNGLSFLLASGTGGGDGSGDVNIYYQSGSYYAFANFDLPPFVGTLTVTPQTTSTVPEPSSVLLVSSAFLALAVISKRRKFRTSV